MAQLGERAGLAESYVSDVERGRKLPSLEKLDSCAEVLGTTVVRLLRQQYPWDSTAPPPEASPPPDGRRRTGT